MYESVKGWLSFALFKQCLLGVVFSGKQQLLLMSSTFAGVLRGPFALTTTQAYNCLPGQSCWPTETQWAAFNLTVNGHLRETAPLGSPCFAGSANYDNATCSTVLVNAGNGTFRGEVYGAMQSPQWEACATASCFPDGATAGGQCELGRLSSYHVDARTVEDVSSTIAFVRQKGIRLVVRNTGHDYLGRSAASNTLALQTFNLKTKEFHSRFTANSCPAANSNNIGIIGAGVTADEAVSFFTNHGMDVTIGACDSIGIAGGFGQAAGHSALGPSRGLMVDQAVEFDVVLADGTARTINECNDPDLFWAMRGGGGGSYAVLTSYKFKVFPTVPFAVYHFQGNIKESEITPNATQSKILRDTWTALATSQTTWAEKGIAGYNFISASNVEFIIVLPAAGDSLFVLRNATEDFASFLTRSASLNIGINEYHSYRDQAAYVAALESTFAPRAPVGLNLFVPSRLIPRSSFATPSSIDVLVEATLKGMEKFIAGIGLELASLFSFDAFQTAPVNNLDTAGATSANPAWREAFWHLIIGVAWPSGTPDETISTLQKAARAGLDEIKAVLPRQAAYTNEADPEEEDWQNVFFGANYKRLASIKKMYDPTTLFNGWKGVGFLGEEEQMYSCYGDDGKPSVPVSKRSAVHKHSEL